MGDSNKVKCGDCGDAAKYRCAKCAYPLCPDCCQKNGGGAFSHPTCPRCGSKDWKGV